MQKIICTYLAVTLLVAGTVSANPQAAPPAAPAAKNATAEAPREPGLYMTFETEKGNITCKLFENEAPITVRTMVGLAIGKMAYIDPRTKTQTRKKFFDGLTFHRV